MKRAKIVQIAREEWLDDVADVAEDTDAESVYSITTRQLVRWCGQGERVACRSGDARLIYDEDTSATCTITLVEAQRAYPLDERVIRVDRMLYGGADLEKTTASGLDDLRPGWRQYDAGAPGAAYIRGHKLYLDRVPAAAQAGEAIALHVWREPLKEAKENEAPEIPARYHEDLVHWLVYRAKSRADSAMYDSAGAAEARRMFERRFGAEMEAKALEALLESPGHIRHHTGRAYSDDRRSSGSDWVRDDAGW